MAYDPKLATNQLQDLYKATQASQLTKQQQARDQQLLNLQNQQGGITNQYKDVLDQLNLQRSSLTPQYQALRNQDYTGTLKNLQGINEQSARQGQYYGGVNQQLQGQERSAFENRMGQYDVQQQQQLAGINTQQVSAERQKADQLGQLDATITQLKNQGLGADNALIQQLEAQKIQSLMELNQFNAQNELAVSALTGTYDGQKTLAAQGQEQQLALQQQQLALQRAGLLGTLDGQQTLDAQQMAQQKAIQEAGLTGQYNGQQTLQAQEMAQQEASRQSQLKMQEAGLTGLYDNAQTLDAQQMAQQKAIQEAGLTGQYNGQQTLEAQQIAQQKALQEAGLTGQYNGQQTLQGKGMTSDLETQRLQQEGLKTQNAYQPEILKQQLEQGKANLESIGIENSINRLKLQNLPKEIELSLDKLGKEISGMEIENQMSKIKQAALPDQIKADLVTSAAQAYATRLNANVNQQQVGLQKERLEMDQQKLYNDMFSTSQEKVSEDLKNTRENVTKMLDTLIKNFTGDPKLRDTNKLEYISKLGSVERKQMYDAVAPMIAGSGLSIEEKVKLIGQTGLTEFIPK